MPLDIEPLDIEPLDMEPLDMEPAVLAFFFGVAVFLSVIAPLDIEPVDAPLDMPLVDEPFDMEPFDMEPVLLACAKADPATATLKAAAAANTASLDISYSQ